MTPIRNPQSAIQNWARACRTRPSLAWFARDDAHGRRPVTVAVALEANRVLACLDAGHRERRHADLFVVQKHAGAGRTRLDAQAADELARGSRRHRSSGIARWGVQADVRAGFAKHSGARVPRPPAVRASTAGLFPADERPASATTKRCPVWARARSLCYRGLPLQAPSTRGCASVTGGTACSRSRPDAVSACESNREADDEGGHQWPDGRASLLQNGGRQHGGSTVRDFATFEEFARVKRFGDARGSRGASGTRVPEVREVRHRRNRLLGRCQFDRLESA